MIGISAQGRIWAAESASVSHYSLRPITVFTVQALRTVPEQVVAAAIAAVLAACLVPAGATAQTDQRLQQRIVACTTCHGNDGEGLRLKEYLPRIGGKPRQYLYNQLENFKSGRRATQR